MQDLHACKVSSLIIKSEWMEFNPTKKLQFSFSPHARKEQRNVIYDILTPRLILRVQSCLVFMFMGSIKY